MKIFFSSKWSEIYENTVLQAFAKKSVNFVKNTLFLSENVISRVWAKRGNTQTHRHTDARIDSLGGGWVGGGEKEGEGGGRWVCVCCVCVVLCVVLCCCCGVLLCVRGRGGVTKSVRSCGSQGSDRQSGDSY